MVSSVLRTAIIVIHAVEICPDEVLLILDAQFHGQVVEHTQVLAVERTAIQFVSHLPTLLLDVLEVVAGNVAPFVLHPRDGTLAGLRIFADDGSDRRLHVFALLSSGRIVGPHLGTHLLGQRYHPREAVVLGEFRSIPQNVRLAVDVHSANAQSSVAVILILDERAHSLRPLHIVQMILQLPRLQPRILEVRVAIVFHGPRLLVQSALAVSAHDDVEQMTRRPRILLHRRRHVVRNPVVLPRDEVPGVACILQLCPSLEDGRYLLPVACSRCQRVQCNNSHVRLVNVVNIVVICRPRWVWRCTTAPLFSTSPRGCGWRVPRQHPSHPAVSTNPSADTSNRPSALKRAPSGTSSPPPLAVVSRI